jgi:hypothetical protein
MGSYELSQADIDFFAQTSLARCRPDCVDYHYTRPYLLASRKRIGPWGDEEAFSSLLGQALPVSGRILLAGSADAGLLSFVSGTMAHRKPSIVIADRCETPLLICQRYAAEHGLRIETVQADLAKALPEGDFDVVVAHLFVRFLPRETQPAFLAGVRSALSARRGALVVAELGPRGGPRSQRMEPASIISSVEERGFTVRDPVRLTAAFGAFNAPREDRYIANLETLVEGAGLKVLETRHVSAPGTARMLRTYHLARPS